MHFGKADKHPGVFQVMIGDVISIRVVNQHFFALLEGSAHHQRFVVFLQPHEQLAADFESSCSV
jgi:hypothetical protein